MRRDVRRIADEEQRIITQVCEMLLHEGVEAYKQRLVAKQKLRMWNSYVRRVELQNETCSQVLDWDLFKEISSGAASEQGRGLPLTSNGNLKPREQDIP